MHVKSKGAGDAQGGLPEVRAGLVLVKPKNASRYDEGGGGTRRWACRGKTWVLPLMRAIALAMFMLCLTPTRSMGVTLAMMDGWVGGPETDQHEYRRPHGSQRQGHVVFVAIPEESAVLPLKALAQEMIARGYRASFALPRSFQSWVEDIPGLAFIPLNRTSNNITIDSEGSQMPSPSVATASDIAHDDITETAYAGTDGISSCPPRPPDPARRACAGKGLGDTWGGGIGGGWGGGLGLWMGLRGSLVGARELLKHFRAYLGFYHREEVEMYAPLVEAFRRDPPALVVADRRALAALRACSKLGLRCVVNSAELLGDLDCPPSSIPAPYTGFPLEGQTIGQRLHSGLVRLVMSLSRMQAARDADGLAAWQDHEDPQLFEGGRGYLSEESMVLGNSCFGSLEYPRPLPPRVHMVGPLWMRGGRTDVGDTRAASPGAHDCVPSSEGEGARESRGCGGIGGSGLPGTECLGCRHASEEGRAGRKVMDDVWAWLQSEGVEEDHSSPVVVLQLGRGGGEAWGVSPDAALAFDDGVGAGSSWEAFQEETVSRLSAVGCRTLWLGNPNQPHQGRDSSGAPDVQENIRIGGLEHKQQIPDSQEDAASSSSTVSYSSDHGIDGVYRAAPPAGCERLVDGEAGQGIQAETPSELQTGLRNASTSSCMVVEALEAGPAASSYEVLLRVMSHPSVTVLVTDGDLRSLQTSLWHGKPAVVLPTSLDQREAALRLEHLGAGGTCRPPCNSTSLAEAVIAAHNPEGRQAALRARTVLRESGGVDRAANLLQNELHTHIAAMARRNGFPCDGALDVPPSPGDVEGIAMGCWSRNNPANWRDEWHSTAGRAVGAETVPQVGGMDFDLDYPELEDATWYPDEPEWIFREMSWAQRHLVDVYAVYGALVMGVGLLMKLTWNLVWSLCDISTAPAHQRSNASGADRDSPSSSPGKDGATNGTGNCSTSGKLGRSGNSKWSGCDGGSGGGVSLGGGGGGKHNKGGPGGKFAGNGSVHHAHSVPSGRNFSKTSAITNGHS